jgi:hypothetical protein
MSKLSDGNRSSEKDLRWASDHLCQWRVCANAACRRARRCRGHAHSCAGRNYHILPKGVRDWFECLLAAKHAGLSFEQFREETGWSEEAEAYFAWRRAAQAKPQSSRAARRGGTGGRRPMPSD